MNKDEPESIVEAMDLYRSMLDKYDMENVFTITDRYIKICNLQTEIFCDEESPHYLVRTYFFIIQGRKAHKETNVTSLANFHGISRASMLRKLRAWEADGKLSLVKRTNETVVYGNATALKKMCEYIDRLQNFFTPIKICREARCKPHESIQNKIRLK